MSFFNTSVKASWIITLMALTRAVAYNVSALEQRPHSTTEKVIATLLPDWYNSFKIADIVTKDSNKSNFWHYTGALFLPDSYAAFQLAKLKNPQVGDGEKALAVLMGPAYSLYASSILKERQALGFTTGDLAPKQKLDVISQAPMPITPPTCYQPYTANMTPQILASIPAYYNPMAR